MYIVKGLVMFRNNIPVHKTFLCNSIQWSLWFRTLPLSDFSILRQANTTLYILIYSYPSSLHALRPPSIQYQMMQGSCGQDRETFLPSEISNSNQETFGAILSNVYRAIRCHQLGYLKYESDLLTTSTSKCPHPTPPQPPKRKQYSGSCLERPLPWETTCLERQDIPGRRSSVSM